MIIFYCIALLIAVVIGYNLWRRWLIDRRLHEVVDFTRDNPPSEHRLIRDLLRMGFYPSDLWHDLYVPKGDGHYAQIDAVSCTESGIIVFEVKEYRGKIYGDEFSYYWKQYIPGRDKRTFYNPVKQNEGHIRALRQLLRPYGSMPFYSVVVFYGECRIKYKGDLPSNTFLIRGKKLRRTVKGILRSDSEAIYRNEEVLYDVLDRCASYGAEDEVRAGHIQYVSEYVASLRHRPCWIVRLWRWLLKFIIHNS